MSTRNPKCPKRFQMSRRAFFATAAGTAALPLLGQERTTAQAQGDGGMLRDYVGRLCYNENPLGPAPAAIEAITNEVPMGHRYSDWFAESLRSDLATLYDVASGQIVAGCGATELLRLAAFGLANPDGNVICATPSYGQFGADASFMGAAVKYVALDAEHRVDLAGIAALIDANTTAVAITNPNNPTATVLSSAAIDAFVATLPEHVALVIDEAYHDYVQDPTYKSAIDLVSEDKNVLVVRTFSKAAGMAGVRIGYAIGRSNIISAMRTWQQWGTVSRYALVGARAALTDTDHITNTVTLNNEVKDYCFTSLVGMGVEFIPSETNFFMADVGNGAGVASRLADRDIYVRSGWGMPAHIRVSTGTMEEMEAFIVALEEILAAMMPVGENYRPHRTALHGNFPNPAPGATRISYGLAGAGPVLLQIFDIRGRLVKTVVDENQSAGQHALDWNGTDQRGHGLAAGSYFYRLQSGDFSQTRRLILL